MARLTYRYGPEVREVELTREMRVGRLPDNELQTLEPRASRHHFRIIPTGNDFFLEDLGSANGTKVNGRRVTRYLLQDGDVIQVGEAQFVFRADRAPAPAREQDFAQAATLVNQPPARQFPCPRCRALNAPPATFCQACGAPLHEQRASVGRLPTSELPPPFPSAAVLRPAPPVPSRPPTGAAGRPLPSAAARMPSPALPPALFPPSMPPQAPSMPPLPQATFPPPQPAPGPVASPPQPLDPEDEDLDALASSHFGRRDSAAEMAAPAAPEAAAAAPQEPQPPQGDELTAPVFGVSDRPSEPPRPAQPKTESQVPSPRGEAAAQPAPKPSPRVPTADWMLKAMGRPRTWAYAAFWQRLLAAAIDALLPGVPLALLALLVTLGLAQSPLLRFALDAVLVLLYFAISWGHSVWGECSSRQATLGKRLLGIKVCDEAGGPLTPVRASIRFLAKLPSALFCGLGFLIQPFTAKKQTLHDLLANALVIQA